MYGNMWNIVNSYYVLPVEKSCLAKWQKKIRIVKDSIGNFVSTKKLLVNTEYFK